MTDSAESIIPVIPAKAGIQRGTKGATIPSPSMGEG